MIRLSYSSAKLTAAASRRSFVTRSGSTTKRRHRPTELLANKSVCATKLFDVNRARFISTVRRSSCAIISSHAGQVSLKMHTLADHEAITDKDWDAARNVARQVFEHRDRIEAEIIKAKTVSPTTLATLYERQAALASAIQAAEALEEGHDDWVELLELCESGDRELAELAEDDLHAHALDNHKRLCKDITKQWSQFIALDSKLQSAMESLISAEQSAEDSMRADQVILELRPGVGGDEAAMFTKDLLRAYRLLANSKGWKLNPISESSSDVTALVDGPNVAQELKFEGGVHRVQRVPETEKKGKTHTSTVTVAVFPVPKDDSTVQKFELDPKELKIEVFRASGAGGQHVNTTESAVRITHLPTGAAASIQDERSQHANKQKAMMLLTSRVAAIAQNEQQEARRELRSSQVGTANRNERIRTYNFSQNRVTDHRTGTTVNALGDLLDGDAKAWDRLLDDVRQGLQESDQN